MNNPNNLGQRDKMRSLAFRQFYQTIYTNVFKISGTITIILLLGTIVTMIFYGWKFLFNPSKMIEIVTTNNWYPADEFDEGSYGALAMIYGTFLVGIPALIMSILFGLSISVFLSEYVPKKISRLIQPIIEYIAAIPSVIFGLIAFIYISKYVKLIFNVESGRGPMTASITLAIMATPIIISISFDALQSTPNSLRNSAKAFGATRYEVFRVVALPHASKSIAASILLAFSRVLGETMVVLMILGNSPAISWSLFKPAYTLTSAIANEIGDARFGSAEFSVLFVLAFILLVISFIVIWISNLITSGNPTFMKFIAFVLLPFNVIFIGVSKIIQLFTSEINFSEEQIRKRIKLRIITDYVVQMILGLIMFSLIITVFGLLFKVLLDGIGVISINFLITFPTFTSLYKGEYGIYSAIIGSFGIVILSALIAFPISTATGIYLSEFAKDTRFTRIIKMSIINISAIPSIVVGLFVYGLFSVYLGWQSGLLPGAISLGIMMIPIVTTNTIEALRNVPQHHKHSALVLGSTNLEAVMNHRLPYALPSIITGYVLSVARVIGETAPLLLTAAAFNFSASAYPSSLVRETIRVLPFEIYYNLLYSSWDDAVLWALGTAIFLLVLVAMFNIAAYAVRKLVRKRYEYNGNI